MPNNRLEKIKKAAEYKKSQKIDYDIEEAKIENEIRKLYPRAKELCVLLKELDTRHLLSIYPKKFFVNQENKIGFAYVDEKTFTQSSDKSEYDHNGEFIYPTFSDYSYYGSSIAICIKSTTFNLALTENGELLQNCHYGLVFGYFVKKSFLNGFNAFEREVFDFIDNLKVGDK